MENKNTNKKKLVPDTRETTERVVYTEKAATALFGKEAVAKAKTTKNENLHKAKEAKSDEFYTLLETVEAELMHYRPHFKGKVVLCNCDDPAESNFFRYFALNFSFLGLKKLIATHYEPNGHSYALIVDSALDVNGDGKIDIKDTTRVELEGNGDFRSPECIAYLNECDIVCTNVPFSLAREYLDVVKKSKKKFLFIGNRNMITYKDFFEEIKNNRLWLGVSPMSCTWFRVPQDEAYRKEGNRFKIENGIWYRSLGNACWFTNLMHKKRNLPLDLVGYKYSPEKYPKYDNYDAIEVAKVSDIPEDYTGVMGVPITFLDKYCPEQFDIIGMTEANGTGHSNGLWKGGNKKATIHGKEIYARIFIKAK